ncbi:MAG: efflux RND transporter periplasmic adaptor subunit [Verrucomicrobiota bacterium]
MDASRTPDPILAELSALRRFDGTPAEFWPLYAQVLARLAGAQRVVLLVASDGPSSRLRRLADWTGETPLGSLSTPFQNAVPSLVTACAAAPCAEEILGVGLSPDTAHRAVAVRLPLPGSADRLVAVGFLLESTPSHVQDTVDALRWAGDVPTLYLAHRNGSTPTTPPTPGGSTPEDPSRTVLDLALRIDSRTDFQGAALTLVNALAERFGCDRVSLGWLEGGAVRLRAMSRTERFDPRMAAVVGLEQAMEECLDQDDEILWPPRAGSRSISRVHGHHARDQSLEHLASVPLRLDGQPVAVLTCERSGAPLDAPALQSLREVADAVVRRLATLHRASPWWGARVLRNGRESTARLLGPEHTAAKLLALLGALALVALLVPIFPHRIEGTFRIRSEEVAVLTAPFQGHIRTVTGRPGDEVPHGAVVLSLDTDALVLEEAAAVADQTRHLREADKARANRNPAEMRIAQAQADQAAARLALVRHRIAQARIRSPFDAVIVEGDLTERLGAPVQQGEALFRVARLRPLFIEWEIPETDLPDLPATPVGEIAFVSRPHEPFGFRVERVEPEAQPRETGSVFRGRGVPEGTVPDWWRPGMTGVCKLDAGRRTLGWILTHRAIDALRLYLWW